MMKLTRRLLIACAAISIISTLAGCAAVSHSPPGTTTTIVLTRHGDRNMLSDELNDIGQQRAEALVEAVGELGISAIYRPDLKRNQQTAQPLEQHLGITSHVVSSKPNMEEVTHTLLSKHAGEAVIWVGNKHNLQRIYSILGGEGASPSNYGDLYIINVKDSGDPEVTKKRYGPS
ncbi:MAG: histidine phosphatase family protein [Halopseudomonas sp.]